MKIEPPLEQLGSRRACGVHQRVTRHCHTFSRDNSKNRSLLPTLYHNLDRTRVNVMMSG